MYSFTDEEMKELMEKAQKISRNKKVDLGHVMNNLMRKYVEKKK